jgi:outer membrane lipoprotein
MKKQIQVIASGLLCSLILAGCASTSVPEAISIAPAGDISVEEVQQQKDRFVDNKVRWGGSIISVQNHAKETRIEILSRNLSKAGKPREETKSGGRFIARIPGFLEPEEFPKDRLMTVTGTLKEVLEQPVGNYPYPYPVVDTEAYYLWPEEKRYPSQYYDPFYDPYFYPYPYWRRYPYW